jgi:Copper transport outer membrane protein, MctB
VIDFRYHLVSIIAVFLALAIGIVIGTAALNGPVTSALQKSNTSLSSELSSQRAQNAALLQQIAQAGTFAQDSAPLLLGHLLDGQRVAVVEAPGTSSAVDSGVIAALRQAGAAISGQVQLQDKFFDTSATTAAAMDGISQGIKPASLTLTGSTPQQRAAQVLAGAIVTRTAHDSADAASQAVLSGFAGPGFLTTSGQPAARATLAVVITPADPISGPNAAMTNQALTDVAAAVSSASLATVMAGPQSSTQPGGSIAALRASDSANQVSTVDDADLAFGQIVIAQVLAEQMSTHSPGSYGTGPGAAAIAPSPMPTVSAPPSVSPALTPKAKRSTAAAAR